mgnify:FL=1
MKRLFPIFLAVVLFSSACLPKKPEISLPEVPAVELARSLELRQQAFSGLKAIAAVQAVRKGRKRAYDTVGIVLQARKKLRMEVYSPLGQSLLTLVWDGQDVKLRRGNEDQVLMPGQMAIERLLGAGVDITELASVLSGNIPAIAGRSRVRAFCGSGGVCIVEIGQGEIVRRVGVSDPAHGAEGTFRITSYELYQSDRLVFRTGFENFETMAGYQLPLRVILENPDNKVSLTIEYADVEVNVPVDDALFTLSAGAEETP